MDETAVRDLLQLVANDEAPPSAVDIEVARSRGRRRRRLWRIYLPGAAPVAAAAVALIAGASAGLGGGTAAVHPPRHGQLPQDDRSVAAPRQLSTVAPYATFGWLPPGFSSQGGQDQIGQNSWQLTLTATASAADGRTLSLTVNPAESCRITIGMALQIGRTRYHFPYALTCAGTGDLPIGSLAPPVHGMRAYWTALNGALVFQYAPDAWATLSPGLNPATCVHCSPHPHLAGWYYMAAKNGHPAVQQSASAEQLLRKIVSQVRFGLTAPISYGFSLSNLPASWRTDRAGNSNDFSLLDGHMANVQWNAGPADDPAALSIGIAPASSTPYRCNFFVGQSSYITVDGAPAVLRIIDQAYKHVQTLCMNKVDGLAVIISLDLNAPGTNDTPLPDAQQVGGVLAVFNHLHLLGPNVADWTTQQP